MIHTVKWVRRVVPLPPVAVAARDEAAKALVHRLLLGAEHRLANLSLVAGARLVVARNEPDTLPWVDGARYLGIDPEAPNLLLPTTSAPDVPVQLFERCLASVDGGLGAPIAVLANNDGGLTLVSLSDGRPPTRSGLSRWLAEYT